jgi:phage gpG-like protein
LNKNHLKILWQLQQFKKSIPAMVDVMGVESNKFFINSFRQQGFTDTTFQAWKKRKDTKDTYKRGGRKRTRESGAPTRSLNIGRAILIGKGSGILKRSIKWRKYGKNAVINYSNLPYAKVHNDGLRAGRGKGFKMPKRQFVGYSKVMNRKIVEKINKIIRRTYK